MANRKRPLIAVMVGNSASEYSAELIAGFRICAREEDVDLVFLMGPHMPEYCRDILSGSFAWDYTYQFHAVYDYVKLIKPDVLIIHYGSLAIFDSVPDVEEFVSRYLEIPCLLMGDRVDGLGVPSLFSGNYSGMRQCIEHLVVDHGYKKIGFVGGPKRNFDSKERLRAYKDVLTEHGIPVDDGLIVHGNYSEVVDEQVNYLLDRYPDIDAIAFANDNMAKGGYRVCTARDILVGHDVAITGFDDVELAKTMEPALTSVSHSSFMYSFQAVQAALKLCRGEKVETTEMKATFRKRNSCGCSSVTRKAVREKLPASERASYIEKRVKAMTEELFSSIPYDQAMRKYENVVSSYFQEVVALVYERAEEEEPSFEMLVRYIKRMCRHPLLAKRVLLEHIEGLLKDLIRLSENEEQRDMLFAIMRVTQQWVYAEDVGALQSTVVESSRKNWFIPSLTMDIIGGNTDLKGSMLVILNRLKAMDIKSAYFLYFEEAIQYKKGTELKLPDHMYLTTYYNEMETVCYTAENMVRIDTSTGISGIIPDDKARYYSSFVLFSGEEQYGMILCEVEQKDFLFMLICSMQLGALRRILRMNIREQQMKQELEEKNRILNFLSAYDELSQLLNRRGFMEKAIHAVSNGKGKKACLLFADVDHLKEINDCFGHAAGDFAIRTSAEYLRNCLPADAITARIGGDEFISLILTERDDSCDILKKRLKKYAIDFNMSCEQPFYVEMSVGAYEFTCGEDVDFEEILRQSDIVLYEEKKRRRSSIKKNIQ